MWSVLTTDLGHVAGGSDVPQQLGRPPVVGQVDQPGRGGGVQVPLDVQLAQPLLLHQVAADQLH